MKIKDGFAMRNIAGSNIVVPVGSNSTKFNGMITLNDTGAFLWSCFSKDITKDEALKMVLDEYEVDEETAKKDIENFVKLITDNNISE